jgi:phosphinothricin acetyltransferase
MIRDATGGDLDAINEIYNRTIVDNHVSFDTTAFDGPQRQLWWESREPELPCLVAEEAGRVVGVSYAGWYRPKPAYRSSAETTIVLAESVWGRGIGTGLLSALCDRLSESGFHRAIAIVALPNEGSIALHHKLGYRSVGVLTEVGTKLGSLWDTEILEKPLARGAV